MVIYTDDFGFKTGCDCTEEIIKLSEHLSSLQESAEVIFSKGIYYLDSEKCREIYKAITNTASPDEYKDKSRINLHKVPFLFENVKNVTFDGCDSTFIIDGKVTNMIISECDNLKFCNFTLKTVNPNLHKFTVKKAAPFKTVFSLNKESEYIKNKSGWSFVGKGYFFGFTETAKFSSWNIVGYPDNKNAVKRGLHPFRDALKIIETARGEFTAYYLLPKKYTVGQSFHIYDCLRSDVGIFIENSRNITFENVTQCFNYSLAFVAQNCDTLSLLKCNFIPDKDSELEIASLADFMQICMCKGKITVRDCQFIGAGDDAINVHGMHFKVEKINNNTLRAVFGHPQTWGFDPFSDGDEIEFIDPKSLLCVDRATVISSKLIADNEIEIVIDKDISSSYENYVIEDVTKCPELEYTGNTISNIVTRGILYTSRGKCIIRDNRFVNTGMSALLFSDDAESWFESGMCKDVLIENNIFEETGKNAVLILPENKIYKGPVHSNVRILNNEFRRFEGDCIYAKATDSISISGNKINGDNKLKLVNCTNVQSDIR